jgi:Concanavalin A-like lectin/glucanases superfamily
MKRLSVPSVTRVLAALCGLVAALSALPARAQCLPPPAGLVAWWPGDGNATDIIGGNNGTLVGTVTYGTALQGKVSQAFSFSGSGQVSLPSAPTSNDFTIDAWVRPTTYPSSWPYVTIYADNVRGLWLKNGRINWWSPSADRFIGSTPVALNAWTHIALTYSNGVFTAYRNGVFDGSSNFSGEVLPTQNGIGIGGHNGAEPFYGLIDEVEIFNRPLSQGEIQTIYAAGAAGKCKPQIKGYTWIKKSSNAVNGTVVVGCQVGYCNPYVGDTPCSTPLPLLCFRPLNAAQPTSTVPKDPFYDGWSGGLVGTTPLYRGDSFPTLADANAACVKEFNDSNWRVAEHHDNRVGGWNFQAYGNVGQHRRFWVHVNDQPKGTCWLPAAPCFGPSCI